MKKLLSIILAVTFALGLNAQTSLTEAPDFTATDYLGNEIHLYEILEGGQYVLMHFNTRTNEATPEVTPPLVEAYKKLGCNQHDVFFVGLVPNGTSNITKQYIEEYGIEFPMIHNTDESNGMQGSAMDITRMTYYVYEYPTTILIAPDKNIVLQDISGIETVDDVINALTPFGIKEYECGENEEPGELTPVVEITVNAVSPTTVEASFVPSAECASYYILLATEDEMEMWSQAFGGASIEQLIVQWSVEKSGSSSNLWKELVPNTEYTIFVLPKDKDGNNLELIKKNVTTESLGGEGVSVIDLQVKVMSSTSVFVTATPNEETSEYHYILIEKAYSDSIGIDSTLRILYADPYALYEVDKWEWINLNANTEFYAIAQGKNINGEWGEITKVEFITKITKPEDGNVELVTKAFDIYPNPASTTIAIIGELGNVKIFDMTGRCVKEVHITDDTTINIEDLNKGVYFVNVNGKVEKLVIE